MPKLAITLQLEASNPSGSVVSTLFCEAKSDNFFLAILDHFQTKNVQI